MLIYVFENSNNNRCENSKDILSKIRPELLNGNVSLLCQQGDIYLKLFFVYLPRLCGHCFLFQICLH